MIVLAPESISAVRAAQKDVLQKSLNLALGSSLATIGLTIPAVAITSVVIGKGLVLGLNARDTLLLSLTLFISLLTFGTGAHQYALRPRASRGVRDVPGFHVHALGAVRTI